MFYAEGRDRGAAGRPDATARLLPERHLLGCLPATICVVGHEATTAPTYSEPRGELMGLMRSILGALTVPSLAVLSLNSNLSLARAGSLPRNFRDRIQETPIRPPRFRLDA